MKKIAQLALLLALVLGAFQTAQAALLIEPLVGVNAGSKLDYKGGEKYSGGMGFSYGGRLGYQNLGFQLGLDYLSSSIDMDDKDFKSNLKTDEWAAFAGFRFPILVKVYAGYIFSATGDTKNALRQSVDYSSGTGYKLGVGYTLLPFVDLNLEYRQGTFGEYKTGGVKFKDDVTYSSYLLSVSLPFTI